MRLALISDIHGNEVALDAVLADINACGVDAIAHLGDVATLGPRPAETLGRLETLGCTCITGNHDAFLLDDSLAASAGMPAVVIDAVDWARAEISQRELDFVRTFVATATIELAPDMSIVLFHGSPKSFFDNILATTPADELDALLQGHDAATLLAGGHTHIQMMRQHFARLVLNAGSVGMPFEAFVGGRQPNVLAHAEYAIVDASQAGGIAVDLRRVALDRKALRDAAACAASHNPVCAQLAAHY